MKSKIFCALFFRLQNASLRVACNPDYYFLQVTSIVRQIMANKKNRTKTHRPTTFPTSVFVRTHDVWSWKQCVFVRQLTIKEENDIFTTSCVAIITHDLVNVRRNLQLPRHLSDYMNVKYDFDRKQYKMAARLNTIDLRKSTLRFNHCQANTYFHALMLGGRTNHRHMAKIAIRIVIKECSFPTDIQSVLPPLKTQICSTSIHWINTEL